MYESIKNFHKQFLWKPEIKNKDALLVAKFSSFLLCGMGGSALAGDLLGIRVWRNYNLPEVGGDTLIIASSYSGNTEETIDAFKTALSKKLPVAAITTGGKLLEIASQDKIPYIRLPNTGIQPRMSTGFMLRALSKLIWLEKVYKEIGQLPKLIDISSAERQGKELSQNLRGKIPIIYSSNKNFALSYNWKIKFNETAKIPAFCNAFPELNHNEMTGFDTKRDANNFSFIFLEDLDDDQRILKRMRITKKLLEDRKFNVSCFRLHGTSVWHKTFQNLLIADWTAYYLAKYYGTDPAEVPMVEEFKQLIK